MKKLVWCLLTSILLVGISSQAFLQAADIKDPNADLVILDAKWCDYCAFPKVEITITNLNAKTAYVTVVTVVWEGDVGNKKISTEVVGNMSPGQIRYVDVPFPTTGGIYSPTLPVTGYKEIKVRAMWRD